MNGDDGPGDNTLFENQWISIPEAAPLMEVDSRCDVDLEQKGIAIKN